MKLNLNDSKPPSGLDFTSVFQSPSQPPKTYSLQEVGKMTQGLIDAFTNESVVGYERNKAVLDLHKQLQGAQGADRLRLSIELKNAKALEYVERNDFMSMVHDFQGIAGAAAAFASPEIAQQIQVISTHFVNVGVQVAGLAGYGPLAADGAVTPIGFGTAILTAIGHISSVFGKKSGITIERATYEAIGVLSKQIDQLREEMHRRFDDIQFQLFMVSSDIMIQFGLLHKKIDQIDTQLAQIHAAIGSNYKQLQYTLGSISQSVSDLGRQVLDQETRRATKSLTDIIDPILYTRFRSF